MTGEQIIDTIIKGGLFSARCANDESHQCIIVWSSGAAEQLEPLSVAPLGAKIIRWLADAEDGCENKYGAWLKEPEDYWRGRRAALAELAAFLPRQDT